MSNPLIIAGCLAAGCGGLAFAFIAGESRAEKRRAVIGKASTKIVDAGQADRTARKKQIADGLREMEKKGQKRFNLQTRIEQAGLSISRQQYIVGGVILGLALGAVAYLKSGSLLLASLILVIGMIGLPWGWAYELLSPVIIPIAMLTTLVGYLAGYISGQVFVLGWLVAWLIALATTLAALLMTETPGGSTRGWRGLGAVVLAVFAEIPYQCLTLVYRIQTLLRPRQKVAWGEMERSLSET